MKVAPKSRTTRGIGALLVLGAPILSVSVAYFVGTRRPRFFWRCGRWFGVEDRVS